MMASKMLPVAGVALLALILPAQCFAGHTVPAFVWTSSEGLITEAGITAIYEPVDGSELESALLSSSQESQGSKLTGLDRSKLLSRTGLVTVLISGKATRASLGENTRESQALRNSVEAATSSLYLANVYQGPLSLDSSTVQIGSCSPDSTGTSIAFLKTMLDGQRLTVRVCEEGDSDHLQAVEEVISDSKQPYIMAFFGQTDQEQEQDRPIGRSLLQTPANTQVLCDDKCQTQVRLFETIILLVILLWALWIGMNMLHILDTPSKFETEKKDQNRHQD